MCQAKVYLATDGQQEIIAEEVILLEEVPEGIALHTFFDEPQVVQARIASIDFLKHTVSLVSQEAAPDAQ